MLQNRLIHKYLCFILLGIVLLSSASCSKFRKIQKSDDWKVKYDAAVNYYERGGRGDYYKAAVLFEEVLPLIRGSKEAEKAQFYYAYAHYYQQQYILSAHYFKTFYETYSRSEQAQEAMYMHAYSLYLTSPVIDLDQTSTHEAIQAMQTFLNRYPNSQYLDDGTKIIDQLRAKLEAKAFENAKLYQKLGRYKAALVAYDNFENDFPGSEKTEEVKFLKVLVQYQYAKESTLRKQEERFNATIDYYRDFIDNYPESQYAKEAEQMYVSSLSSLEKLNENNQ